MNLRIEMHSIEHLVGSDEQQVLYVPLQNCKIVTSWKLNQLRCALLCANPRDEVELTGHRKDYTRRARVFVQAGRLRPGTSFKSGSLNDHVNALFPCSYRI